MIDNSVKCIGTLVLVRRTQVVAEMDFSGWLDARQDAGPRARLVASWRTRMAFAVETVFEGRSTCCCT
jgi:hypothetical protein